MSIKLKTVVGQLHIAHGVLQEEVDNVLVVESSPLIPLGREKSNLYVMLELEGQPPGRDEISRQLVEIIDKEYSHTPGSITSKLRQAIKRANLFLFEANRQAPRDERRSGGVTCVVLKESDVYIGQAGPALAYVAHKGELSRYPKTSPWLDSAYLKFKEGYLPSLGLRHDVTVELFRCQVQPGDVILLATTPLARLAKRTKVAEAVVYQGVEAALKNLRGLASGQDLSVLVIEVVAAEETKMAGEKIEKLKVEARRPERRFPSRKPFFSSIAASVKRIPLPRLDWAGLLDGLVWGIIALLAFLWSGVRILLRRILPGTEAAVPFYRPRRRARRPRPAARVVDRKRLLIGLAIAIPLIVALVVGIVTIQRGKVTRAYLAELVQQAREKKEQAWARTGDKDAARQLLLEAQGLLNEALTLNPEETFGVDALQREIQTKLDEINNVFKLYWVPRLYEYQDPSSDPSRVIVNGIDIYVLDRGADRVYKHVLNEAEDGLEEPEGVAILREGDPVGEIVVRELVDMIWMPAGGERQTSNLLVLEKGGALLEYSPTWGLKVLPVGAKERWRAPQLMGSYFGNLYLLDPQLNQILKYLPTADGGYNNPWQDYLDPQANIDLGGTVDMAIDGFIYNLFADGTIVKLLSSGEPSSGQPVPFEQTEIDEPLRNPTALFTGPDEETKSIYVADAGNKRIVQFSKEGRFERQFKADDDVLDRLKGLFVDEIGGKLYFVSGNRLYLANLPAASPAD